jgi:hypothetical protein
MLDNLAIARFDNSRLCSRCRFLRPLPLRRAPGAQIRAILQSRFRTRLPTNETKRALRMGVCVTKSQLSRSNCSGSEVFPCCPFPRAAQLAHLLPPSVRPGRHGPPVTPISFPASALPSLHMLSADIGYIDSAFAKEDRLTA